MKLALKTIGISILSISVLVSFGLTSNQAFAGVDDDLPQSCDECEGIFQQCLAGTGATVQDCDAWLDGCIAALCRAVGGDMIQMETTSILAAGAQYTAAWMIPVLVSGIGIAIVIARKF